MALSLSRKTGSRRLTGMLLFAVRTFLLLINQKAITRLIACKGRLYLFELRMGYPVKIQLFITLSNYISFFINLHPQRLSSPILLQDQLNIYPDIYIFVNTQTLNMRTINRFFRIISFNSLVTAIILYLLNYENTAIYLLILGIAGLAVMLFLYIYKMYLMNLIKKNKTKII